MGSHRYSSLDFILGSMAENCVAYSTNLHAPMNADGIKWTAISDSDGSLSTIVFHILPSQVPHMADSESYRRSVIDRIRSAFRSSGHSDWTRQLDEGVIWHGGWTKTYKYGVTTRVDFTDGIKTDNVTNEIHKAIDEDPDFGLRDKILHPRLFFNRWMSRNIGKFNLISFFAPATVLFTVLAFTVRHTLTVPIMALLLMSASVGAIFMSRTYDNAPEMLYMITRYGIIISSLDSATTQNGKAMDRVCRNILKLNGLDSMTKDAYKTIHYDGSMFTTIEFNRPVDKLPDIDLKTAEYSLANYMEFRGKDVKNLNDDSYPAISPVEDRSGGRSASIESVSSDAPRVTVSEYPMLLDDTKSRIEDLNKAIDVSAYKLMLDKIEHEDIVENKVADLTVLRSIVIRAGSIIDGAESKGIIDVERSLHASLKDLTALGSALNL